MKTVYFYSVIAGFIAGIFIGLVGVPAFPAAALVLLLAGAFLFLYWRQPSRSLLITLIVLLAVSGGLLRAGFDIGEKNETVFDPVLGEQIEAEGVVATVPEITSSGQNVTVEIEKLSPVEGEEVIRGVSKAVVYARSFPELSYGDNVELTGEIREPSRFETDTGRMFNYPRYLAREEVFYEMPQPMIEVTGGDSGNFLKGLLASLREDLLSVIHRQIPDPHAALTGGVILGAEDALGEALEQDFRDAGVIHIVVLSGYHVTTVAVAIGAILLFAGLSVTAASVIAIGGVALFALLVGLTPTVIRASIMAIIALFARIFSRQYAASRGLALAAVLMVGVNPHILLFDPSFQLSAVATAGLIGFGDSIADKLSVIPVRFGLREMATATIAAQIAVSPLLVFYTGELSLVSLIANILVLPVVPVLMAAGAATAAVGMIFSWLAFPFSTTSYVTSEYIFGVVDWLTNLPFSTASIGSVSVWSIIITYMVFGATIFYYKTR